MSRLALGTSLAPEQLLNGRYQVIEVLSSVGWGKTYIATDTHRPGNPKCVVKQIQPVSDAPGCLQAAKRLFNREAKILKMLGHHDQVSQLLDGLEGDRSFYIVQEFIAGQPLSAELPPGQPWSERPTIHLLQDVLSILRYVHDQGVIHGDLQPDKLIRRKQDGKLVLIGFNAINQARTQLVTVREQLSSTVALGALGYMPMEQIRGNPCPSSDIYALGMIGIQALTGLNPMQLEEDPQTGEVVWQQQAIVSDELAGILSQMVRYRFKDRYQSAAEVLEVLQSLISCDRSTQLSVPLHPPLLSTLLPQAISDLEVDTFADTTIALATSQTALILAPISSTSPKKVGRGAAGVATSLALTLGAGGYLLALSPTSFNLLDRGVATLSQAREKYQTGNLQEAVALAQSISSDSAAYQDAQSAMQAWQKDWQNAQAQFEAVKKAVAESRWLDAIEQARRTPNIDFWQQQIQPMVSQAQTELETEAYQLLQQAYNRATDKDFAGALNSLERIPKQTKAYAKVQPKIAEYAQKRGIKADYLLQQAYNQAAAQDFTGALASLKQIPNDTPAYANAQSKITEYTQKERIRANHLLQKAYNWADEKDFTRALEYLQQIPEDAPTYAQVREKIVEYTEKQGLKATNEKPTEPTTAPVNRPAPSQPFKLEPFTRNRASNESGFEMQIPSSVPQSPSNLDPGSRLQEVTPQPLVTPRAYPASGAARSGSGE